MPRVCIYRAGLSFYSPCIATCPTLIQSPLPAPVFTQPAPRFQGSQTDTTECITHPLFNFDAQLHSTCFQCTPPQPSNQPPSFYILKLPCTLPAPPPLPSESTSSHPQPSQPQYTHVPFYPFSAQIIAVKLALSHLSPPQIAYSNPPGSQTHSPHSTQAICVKQQDHMGAQALSAPHHAYTTLALLLLHPQPMLPNPIDSFIACGCYRQLLAGAAKNNYLCCYTHDDI